MDINWALSLSLALNFLSALVYFNIPEFLQQIFIKRMEHKFDVKLDRMNRNNEVLPQLFYKVAGAVGHYNINYSGLTYSKRDLIEYAELKNYITKNQFFIPEDVRNLSREVENELLEFIYFKYKYMITEPGDEKENAADKFKKSETKLNKLIDEIEIKIYKVIEN